jgi:hypothetical protein
MSALRDLLESKLSNPVAEQERVNLGFHSAVGRSLLGWRDPAGPITHLGLHIVLGLMVAWNDYERRLVIELERAIEDGRTKGDVIEVFNADRISSVADLQEHITGWEEGMSSPWLGVWRDGELWFRMAGAAATTWLCDRYGLALR